MLAAGALPKPRSELTAILRPPSWTKEGKARGKEGRGNGGGKLQGKGKGGRGGGEGERSSSYPPIFAKQFQTVKSRSQGYDVASVLLAGKFFGVIT